MLETLKSRTGRFPKRRRVTLIASFPALSAFAICADSQETDTQWDSEIGEWYEVRVAVQKIEPVTEGKYQIAICGGGNGRLIDGFVERARRALREQDAFICTKENPASISAIHARLEQELRDYYQNDVPLCPDQDKAFKLFIAAACPLSREFAVWVSENMVLRQARKDRPELNGCSYRLYEDTAQRLFRTGMTVNQAVLASIYTVTIAKNTSNYVRDPFTVAVVDRTGIHVIEPAYVRAMEERLQEYEVQMNALFLSCSDVSVSVAELKSQLEQFGVSAINLHREHIDRQADAMTMDDLFVVRGMRLLPKGPLYLRADKKLKVEHDPVRIEAARKKQEIAFILAGAGPVVVTVRCPNGHTFEQEFPNHKSAYGSTAKCDMCGETKILREMGQGAPDDIRLKNSTQSSAQK